MSETTSTVAAQVADDNSTVAGESTADNTSQDTETTTADEAAVEEDWKAKFEAQQRVNKDLDKKVKADKALRQQFEELQAKLNGTEAEYAEAQKAREVEAAALAKANDRILRAEVRAAAAAKLADPADALRFIDLTEFEVGDDGDVDTSAVNAAIETLLTEKPYLAAQGGTTGTVFESATTHRKGAQGQLTHSDVQTMSPDQINAARAEGRLNDLLGIN